MTDGGPIRILLVTWDRETASVTFTRDDGMEATLPMEHAPAQSPQIARLQWSPFALSGVLVTTEAGDQFTIELPAAGEDPGDRRGRPVVYLDQLHWSAFHKVGTGARVHPDDAAAVEQISRWASEGLIILPASSGHYLETTKWTNTGERYEPGVKILSLSRGWHMLDPLAVRRDELRREFLILRRESPEPSHPVFTRDTDSMLAALPLQPVRTPDDFPAELARAHGLLTRATAIVAVMLDEGEIESAPPTGWTSAQQRYSDWLREQDRDAKAKRASTDAMLLSDLQPELGEEATRAGLSSAQMSDWLLSGTWTHQLSEKPSLGLYREVFQQRHLAGGPWRENDLTDMVYLCCAGAYADFEVTERQLASFLNQSNRRLGRPVTVYKRLRDLVEPLGASIGRVVDRGLRTPHPLWGSDLRNLRPLDVEAERSRRTLAAIDRCWISLEKWS